MPLQVVGTSIISLGFAPFGCGVQILCCYTGLSQLEDETLTQVLSVFNIRKFYPENTALWFIVPDPYKGLMVGDY